MQKNGKKPRKAAKKAGGRPTLPDGERKSKRLDDVRFSPQELAGLRERAAAAGLTWSEWIRERLGV